MSDFSREAEAVSRKIAEIADSTLKNTHGNVKAMSLHSTQNGKVYCRTIQACEFKQEHTVYLSDRRGRRRYLLCINPESCNQKSFEKAFYYDIPK